VNRRPLAAALAAAALALGALAAVPPAASAAPAPGVVTAPTGLVSQGRYALGDSVMLGAAAALDYRSFTVNARTSRQFSTAVPLVQERLGWLPRNLVIHLGTNGYISLSDCKRVVSLAGSGRRVFLVTTKAPREWQSTNNSRIRACDAAFAPGRVMVIDWYRAAVNNPSWVYSDGIHLTSRGRTGYATLIDTFVDRFRL
jgi:hypothetical protein